MNTEQNVLEKLKPLAESEVRLEFVEAIPRPSRLVRPTRGERLRELVEERFCFGEFGIALGAFVALVVLDGMNVPEFLIFAALSCFISARMLTALVGGRATSPGSGVVAGVAGTFTAWILTRFCTFFWLGSSPGDLYLPMELLKVSLLSQPVRFVEFLVFGGGVSALLTFLARWRLEQKPWLSGVLHSQAGRKGWRGLAVLLGALMVTSLLASPNSEERKTNSQRWFPMTTALGQALEQDDFESADRILMVYPDALEWSSYGKKVTGCVASLDMARYVVDNGGDFTAAGGYGSALERAVRTKNDPLLEFLLAHGADPNVGFPLALVTAVEDRRLYAVQVLLDHGADPEKIDHRGSALDVAKKSNDRGLLHALKDAQK